ncbi:MAG: hypothetical protein K2K02_04200, partial [Ruminococcus sp.]|nr:hypothetical protein [Ruminococcus sp.]
MNNDNAKIANYLDNLKKELGINELETDTSPNTNTCESDEPSAVNSIPVSEQPYQPEPADDYETFISNNNTNMSVAQNMINLYGGLARCFNKYVQIPNYPAYACTYFDSNYNAYLCTMDFNNQYIPFANIFIEGSEFAVYQNYQRIGTLYGNDNEPVWQFIPNGMTIPTHNPQYIQSNTPNTPTYNYVFNNVPYDQATEIIDSITRNNPANNVEINFASQNTEVHSDEIVIPFEHYSTD